MNIFVLSHDPIQAARFLCDKHVCKMIVETAQMLSTAWPIDVSPYKHTHVNHPCNVWMRSSLSNYKWLLVHGLTLCEEYTKRYNRVHKTETKAFDWFLDAGYPDIIDVGLTPFAIAISDKSLIVADDPVVSYRNYYKTAKARFAKWKASSPPEWWMQ